MISEASSFESVANSKIIKAIGKAIVKVRKTIFAALLFIPKQSAARVKTPIITTVFIVAVRFPDAEKREYVYLSP